MTLVCEFTVPGRAVPERKRQVPPRGAFRGARVDTEDAKAYKSLVTLCASQAMNGRPPEQGPVCLEVHVWREKPASWPKSRQWPTTKPDVENQVKLVADVLTGLAYRDDAQVCDLRAVKRLCPSWRGPGLWVRVTRIGAEDVDAPDAQTLRRALELAAASGPLEDAGYWVELARREDCADGVFRDETTLYP